MSRHVFFLSDLLPFNPVLEVEAPEGSDSDAFVRELAMEQNGSLLKRIACPPLESLRVSQKLDMFFT